MVDKIIFQEPHISSVAHCNFANGNININNSVYNGKSVLEDLYKNAAPGGFHISDERYDPPKCHKQTRLAIRQDLLIQVTTAVVSCIVWLYGAAGAGKSAVAQSFAETCEEQQLLIGSFFFFRTAPLRNNAQRLAASLAYQLARSIPLTLPYIAHCITNHPAIFSSSFEDQIDKLLVRPLCDAYKNNPALDPQPMLVILDGLDECGAHEAQHNIISVIEKALQVFNSFTPIPIRVVVLFVSRPETYIESAFESLDRRASIPLFSLSLNDKYPVDGEIRLYLNDQFKEIKRDHPFKRFLPDVWPLSEDIESIVQKSSGQFIYAATIIRYIRHHKCKPHERLQTALDSSKRFASTVRDSPFQELDALYLQIFTGIEEVVTLLAILSLALDIDKDSARFPGTIAFRIGLDPGDVAIYFSTLASLMVYEGEYMYIRFFHASLQDFLVDEQRSRHLYIKQPAVHTALAKAYMRKFLASAQEIWVLSSCSRHLRLAELDEELSNLATQFESRIPQFIKKFGKALYLQAVGLDTYKVFWDFFPGRSFFCGLVDCVYNLKDIIVRHTGNLTFWDRCLEAIHDVFHTHLWVYLTDEDTHDYLAGMILTSNHCRSALGISGPASQLYRGVDIFKSKKQPFLLKDVAQEVLQNFLLDPHLSGKLFVTPEQCARIAMKCLVTVDDIRDWDYVIEGLGDILRRASQCWQLIDILEKLNRRFSGGEVQEAVNEYLRAHSSKPGAEQTAGKEPCPKELVGVAEEPVDEIEVLVDVVEESGQEQRPDEANVIVVRRNRISVKRILAAIRRVFTRSTSA